jgi:exopolysaccharide production protein ExoY
MVHRRSKRLLDLCVSVALVVLFAPLFAIVLATMGLDMMFAARDRGALLYRERRNSRGREFDLLKFRVLRRNVLDSQRDDERHARLLEADPRNLTWAGRHVLKPWYLDELPQLFNVLRGEMSLVGPRPWPPSMVAAQVAAGHDYRNVVPAGWTGPAQVHKGVVEPAGYIALDLAYVEAYRSWRPTRLLRHDLRILWQTVKVMARGEGLRY